MAVCSATRNPDNFTMLIVVEFAAPPERVWKVWADPRLLERWWGPPTWPATFVTHDLAIGSECHYFMTGPDGEQAHGWWRVLDVDAPRTLEIEDGFADESGAPNPDLPTTRMVVRLEALGPGTLMTVTTTFPSAEAMETVLSMGAEEGITLAMGQIDGLLVSEEAR